MEKAHFWSVYDRGTNTFEVLNADGDVIIDNLADGPAAKALVELCNLGYIALWDDELVITANPTPGEIVDLGEVEELEEAEEEGELVEEDSELADDDAPIEELGEEVYEEEQEEECYEDSDVPLMPRPRK